MEQKGNLALWQAVRCPPREALRRIEAGRLKGKTDINPVWRIKALTEQFGPCGAGWYYDILSQRLEPGADGETAAFVDIRLYVKWQGEWSKPIPGAGGAMYISKERNGFYTDDEAFKKALTDAISVSCKALGFAADVYWDRDPTKYTAPQPPSPPEEPPERQAPAGEEPPDIPLCENCGGKIRALKRRDGSVVLPRQVAQAAREKFGRELCWDCYRSFEREDSSPDDSPGKLPGTKKEE